MINIDQESNGVLRVAVFIDPRWTWRWHKWLVEGLAARGHQVDLCISGTAQPIPAKLRLLLQLERLLYRHAGEFAADPILPADCNGAVLLDQPSKSGYDLMIDLAGDTDLDGYRCRRLRPLYDGRPDDAELVGILLDRRVPRLSLEDSALSEPRRLGLCAIEHPDVVFRGLNNVFSRLAGVMLKAVDDIAERHVAGQSDPAVVPHTPVIRRRRPLHAGRFFVSNLAAKLSRRLMQLSSGGPRWGVGWRHTVGRPVRETFDLSLDDYQRVPDDGARFYADPFVVKHGGVHHIFVEEYPFETGVGIISHFTIDAAGRPGTPQPILSRPYHLSYPFVFQHDGTFYMIPETSANRTIELYRAERFPDRWVLEKVLVNDVIADDATLTRHDGRWWMFAAVSEWQSSQWDALGLYSADDLFGEWRGHPANPVLLDARAARPAGAMFRKDGALYRPAQDCSSGYGAGLALCRVDRLDEQGYAQTVERHLYPIGNRRITGLHTLNEDDGVEVIDYFGRF